MNIETDQPNYNFWKFGNQLRAIGGIEIAAIIGIFTISWFVDITNFNELDPYIEIIQLLHDLTLVIILIALMIKSYHNREDVNFPPFSKFHLFLLIYCSFTSFRLVFQWTVYFIVWDLYYFPYLYDSMLIISIILEILAMIMLVKFGSTIKTPIGIKIKKGAIAIIVGAFLMLCGLIIDIVDIYFLMHYMIDMILVGIGGILRIVGFFKAGKNIKFILKMHVTSAHRSA